MIEALVVLAAWMWIWAAVTLYVVAKEFGTEMIWWDHLLIMFWPIGLPLRFIYLAAHGWHT
jgi:hypothetical protein